MWMDQDYITLFKILTFKDFYNEKKLPIMIFFLNAYI